MSAVVVVVNEGGAEGEDEVGLSLVLLRLSVSLSLVFLFGIARLVFGVFVQGDAVVGGCLCATFVCAFVRFGC